MFLKNKKFAIGQTQNKNLTKLTMKGCGSNALSLRANFFITEMKN